MESLIKTVLNNDLKSLKDYMEKNITKHIDNRVQEKKIEVLAKLNNISIDKMKEQLAVS